MTRVTRRRGWQSLTAILVLLLLLAACGDGGAAEEDNADASGDPDPTSTEGDEDGGSDDGEAALAEACGDQVVIQTDWYPQVEHGVVYQFAGTGGEFDPDRGWYTNERDGVSVQIRAGGPFIGFQGGVASLYQDPDILLSFVAQDEAVRTSARQPVTAVFATHDKSPQILMWDPETYDFEEFNDIGESDATVLHFAGAFYTDFLVGQGYIRPEQLDSSYDGSPARFVAEADIVQQGFVTSEPYKYEHEIASWGKPVDYLLVHDSGFEIYPNSSLVVRQDDLEEQSSCLEVVVPMLQQAAVDFLADPEPVKDQILEITDQLEGWAYSQGAADYAVETMVDLEIISNGSDGTVGNFDMDRAERVVDLLAPIYEEGDVDTWDPDVTAEDVVTNRFIDTSIGLP